MKTKRYSTLFVLSFTFIMKVMAWEPVIKETHWFGMYEYYGGTPLFGITTYADITSAQLTNASFSSNDGWSIYASNNYHYIGYGSIGSVPTTISSTGGYAPPSSTSNGTYQGYNYFFEARWSGQYASCYQNTRTTLPAGVYRLTFDIQNANGSTTNATYQNLFYVEVNGTTYTDGSTEWMGSGSGTSWTTHTIDFVVTEAATAKISLGYGTGSNNIPLENTPALFVSNLKLESTVQYMDNNDLTNRPYVSNVTWSGNYLESITVVKDWTSQNPPQQPKTSFYSWLDHKLRFSVENKNYWWLRKGNEGENYYNYDGLGLCNISNGYSKFYIHNLKVGDEFHIEYYRYNNSVSPFLTAEASSPFLEESAGSVSGSTAEYSYSGNSAIFGNNNDGPVF